MNAHLRTPVRIRNVDYPSLTEAAKALHVFPSAITQALNRHGHADTVGLRGKGVRNAIKRPVTAFGRRWSSVAEMRNELRITRWQALEWTKPTATPAMREMLLAAIMKADMDQFHRLGSTSENA